MTAQPTNITWGEAAGSPFALTSSWRLVATVTALTRALQIGDASQSSYDIFWTAVPAGNAAPSNTSVKGLPVLAGEDFATGLPIGDIYLRSASGAVATVMTGV